MYLVSFCHDKILDVTFSSLKAWPKNFRLCLLCNKVYIVPTQPLTAEPSPWFILANSTFLCVLQVPPLFSFHLLVQPFHFPNVNSSSLTSTFWRIWVTQTATAEAHKMCDFLQMT